MAKSGRRVATRPGMVTPGEQIRVWFLGGLALLGLALVAIEHAGWWDLPNLVSQIGTATMFSLLLSWLFHRIGSSAVFGFVTGLAVIGLMFFLNSIWLNAAVTLMAAVMLSVAGVLITRPAKSSLRVVFEVWLAAVAVFVGSFLLFGFPGIVHPTKFKYLTLGLSLILIMALVNKLGAGLHGLGRRGKAMITAGAALLAITVWYSSAISNWGSPSLVSGLAAFDTGLRQNLGAVPQLLPTLLGFPALTWGVFMRARRRQGWWACAFGVVATALIVVSVQGEQLPWPTLLLQHGYELVIGIAIGFGLISLDLYLTGARGNRARQLERDQAIRPEPARLHSLR